MSVNPCFHRGNRTKCEMSPVVYEKKMKHKLVDVDIFAIGQFDHSRKENVLRRLQRKETKPIGKWPAVFRSATPILKSNNGQTKAPARHGTEDKVQQPLIDSKCPSAIESKPPGSRKSVGVSSPLSESDLLERSSQRNNFSRLTDRPKNAPRYVSRGHRRDQWIYEMPEFRNHIATVQ